MRRFASVVSAFALLSCVGDAGGGSATPPQGSLYDPLGLMDVVGDLRLLVFPAEGFGCTADGTVTPALSEEPDAIFEDAVVDIRFGTDEAAMVSLDAGTYVVHVRGFGTDPVSGRMNVIVATGCTADVVIESGETRDITLELQDVVGMGVCGDGILSPDEQCEMATGPLPCMDCRTQAQVLHTTTEATQESPGLGWTADGRLLLTFDSTESTRAVRMMIRGADGQVLTSPSALALDEAVDFGATIPGVQTTSAAAVSSGRLGVAFGDFSTAATMGGDVLVRFFDTNRNPEGAPVLAVPQEGAQTDPAIAMLGDGTALVAFTDGASSSGASGVIVPSGMGPGASFALGESGARTPSVAAAGSGFVVAYASDTGVFAQRVDASGMAGSPIAVDGSGETPAIAALPDGRFFVAWAAGGAIRGRAFDASDMPAGDAIDLGSGAAPSAGAGAERFLVAWESGGNVQGQLFDGDGNVARNRESPPTAGAFTVGAGAAPKVAVGANAGQVLAMIAWETGGDIQGRLYPLP